MSLALAIEEANRRGLNVKSLLPPPPPPEKQIVLNHADPVRWIEENVFIPELKAPIILGEYQRRAMSEALRRNDSGQYAYSTIVWSDIKKSAKTTLAAAVALYVAYHVPMASIKIVANDLKQADSRVAQAMRNAVRLNPVMNRDVRLKALNLQFPNESRVEAIPIDPSGEAGGNDDLIIFSELWAAKSAAMQTMWTELTLSPTKFGQSFTWVESYAGYEGASPILERLYNQGVRDGAKIWPDLSAYRNEAARLFCLWNETPRLPWQTRDYYSQQEASLGPSEFSRVHENKWQASLDRFLPPGYWQACQVEALPPLYPFEPVVVGIDAGVSSDNFAIVGVSRRGDRLYLRFAFLFVPPKGGKLDFDAPREKLKELAKAYNVVCFAYDEYQLHDMATSLQNGGYGWFFPFPQGAPRLLADKGLYDIIRDKRVEHDGSFNEVGQHIANANAQKDGENKLRLVKNQKDAKIDLAVAFSMAAYQALDLNIG